MKKLLLFLFLPFFLFAQSYIYNVPCTDNAASTVVTNNGTAGMWVSNPNTNTLYLANNGGSFALDLDGDYIRSAENINLTEFYISFQMTLIRATSINYECHLLVNTDGSFIMSNNEIQIYRTIGDDEWVIRIINSAGTNYTKTSSGITGDATTNHLYLFYFKPGTFTFNMWIDGIAVNFGAWSVTPAGTIVMNSGKIQIGDSGNYESDGIVQNIKMWEPTSNYYVDQVQGDDDYNGHSIYDPWKTIAKVNGSTFAANDSIYFRTGCTWREQLTIPHDSLYFRSYDSTGQSLAKPIINGSDLITPGTNWATVSAWQDGVVRTASANAATINSRNIIPADESSYDGAKIRITVQSGSAVALALVGTSIGLMTSTSVFDASPTRITWNTGHNDTNLAAGATAISDEITFAFDKTLRYGLHFASSGDANSTQVMNTTDGSYWTYTGDQTMVLNPTINGSSGTAAYGITKLEVYDITTNVWQTALTTEPQIAFFDTIKGIKESALANLNTTTEWFWVSNILYVYAISDPDALYTNPGIEAGQRDSAIIISGKKSTIIDGINTKGTNSHIIAISGALNENTIKNCTISYNGTNAGIIWWMTGGTGANVVDNCTIHDITGDGITWWDSLSSLGNESYLKNSTIYNTGKFGAYLKTNYLIVENNIVYDVGTVGTENWGIGIQCELVNSGTGKNNIIRYNKIYNVLGDNTDACGIMFDHWTRDNDAYYNLVYNCQGTGITVYNAKKSNVYNNTFYGNNQSGTDAALAELALYSTGDLLDSIVVKNNIGFSTVASTYSVFVNAEAAGNTLTITNNDWYRVSGNWYSWSGTPGATLATWNALTGVGTDLNSNPMFISSSNFNLLKTSPCIDAGVNVSLTTDYMGLPVPKNKGVDIGAYEYQLSLGKQFGFPHFKTFSNFIEK